jgi:hypothetical protein
MVYLLLTYNLFHIAGLSVAAIHAKAEGARPKPGAFIVWVGSRSKTNPREYHPFLGAGTATP